MFCLFLVVKVFDQLGSATVLVTFGHVVVLRREAFVGPPTASRERAPENRGCPCRDPLGCCRCPGWMTSRSRAPTLVVVVWSVVLSMSSCSCFALMCN